MRKLLRDAEHLGRVALLLLGGAILFMIAKSLFVPAGFGMYGHFRGPVLAEIRARPVRFAGREACAACHDEVVQAKNRGRHARVGCEACHGALARHAEDPQKLKPVKPDSAVLCARCHEANVAKPQKFPQVDTKEHMAGVPCGGCHQPHNPKPGG